MQTSQKEEIKTIKERNIVLNLSDKDCERVSRKAAAVGLTVSELLENFIGDLVAGTYSNGSDERAIANEWFERCWFSLEPDKSFLRYLILTDCIFDVIERWEDIQAGLEEISAIKKENTADSQNEIKSWEDDISYWQEMIDECWKEYAEDWNPEHLPFNEEMSKIMEWNENLENMKEGE